MTWIERTACPQIKRLTSARVLHAAGGGGLGRTAHRQPGVMFRADAGVEVLSAEEVWPDHGSSSSAKAHRKLARRGQGVKYDASRARAIATAAIRKAAQAKNNPADLLNVATGRPVIDADWKGRRLSPLAVSADRLHGPENVRSLSWSGRMYGAENH